MIRITYSAFVDVSICGEDLEALASSKFWDALGRIEDQDEARAFLMKLLTQRPNQLTNDEWRLSHGLHSEFVGVAERGDVDTELTIETQVMEAYLEDDDEFAGWHDVARKAVRARVIDEMHDGGMFKTP